LGIYSSRVLRIPAERSPNVLYAQEEIRLGRTPSNTVIVPGIVTWDEYQRRLQLWDSIRQTIGLGANFYEGAENLLYPPQWLDRAAQLAKVRVIKGSAKSIGVDVAEGGDNTTMAAGDELGILDLVSEKTKDTEPIPRKVIAFMNRWKVPPDRVVFDRGGGGQQHVDRLRAMGYNVRSVGFGEGVTLDLKRGTNFRPYKERLEVREERYVYMNRRAQMFGELSLMLDETYNPKGFAIPGEFVNPIWAELRKQMAVIPKGYDKEGRLKLPPKNKTTANSKEKTLVELIGHSPDELDACACCLHALLHKATSQSVAGSVI
jgi:hypothetical protein